MCRVVSCRVVSCRVVSCCGLPLPLSSSSSLVDVVSLSVSVCLSVCLSLVCCLLFRLPPLYVVSFFCLSCLSLPCPFFFLPLYLIFVFAFGPCLTFCVCASLVGLVLVFLFQGPAEGKPGKSKQPLWVQQWKAQRLREQFDQGTIQTNKVPKNLTLIQTLTLTQTLILTFKP